MRPASRSNLGSSGGAPPGTGMRPGSGMRKPPGTSRLRTGMAPSGPGTEAAQGIALSASINVSDRPMTGHGVMGMKAQGQNGGRLVEDVGYYVGLLRKKISDVNSETIKLRTEVEQQSKDSSQYTQLEKRYENLIKSKESLEGQLADYNLALDKVRSATDADDVYQMAMHMAEKNRSAGQDLDRIFMQRKSRESETAQVEDQIAKIHESIQRRINDLEPGKLRAYNELMSRQKELHERFLNCEHRLNEINTAIRSYESDDKANSLRKEYMALEKQVQAMKKDADALQEELDIANLDPKEAHTRFVARVNAFKQQTKQVEDKMQSMRDDIVAQRKALEELQSSHEGADSEDAAKYDLLVKRDADMTAFIDKFDDSKGQILSEQREAQFMIVALLEHIGKGLEDSTSMPSQEAVEEMETAKQFKEKNLATAQKTMESLVAEKKKRDKELDMLRSSEPKLLTELSSLRESMSRMKAEMEDFQDLDRIRREFNQTKNHLTDLKANYIKRRDTLRQQIQSITVEHESLKKQLNSNEIARELDDTEKRLKHYEKAIFDLKEFVDSKSRETDYEHVRGLCLKLADTLNSMSVRSNNQQPGGGYHQQAKW